ncbi:MAG: hypothetical protein Q8Q62_08405, partial [Mesorhizobium sp.]|nr:hypothetical protein [Mesorhizobium sp.]
MSIQNTPYLRNVLLLDGLVSGFAGLVMAAGAAFLSPLLALPQPLLLWAGLLLLPWCLALVLLARRPLVSRMVLVVVAGINALWVIASFGILLAGLVQPYLLGVAFVGAQALTVAVFAALQFGVL